MPCGVLKLASLRSSAGVNPRELASLVIPISFRREAAFRIFSTTEKLLEGSRVEQELGIQVWVRRYRPLAATPQTARREGRAIELLTAGRHFPGSSLTLGRVA